MTVTNTANGIKLFQPLDRLHVQEEEYTFSLLKEGYQAGVVSMASMEEVQQQLGRLMNELVVAYNDGRSSSIQKHKAAVIMKSLMYGVDTCLLSFKSHSQALSFLLEEGMKKAYDNGLVLNNQRVAENQKLFEEMKENKIQTSLYIYNHLYDGGIDMFFREYDPVFAASDTPVDIDYPLAFDDMGGSGIAYVNRYLKKLQAEESFCKRFPQRALENLLRRFGRQNKTKTEDLFLNLFELVFKNAVICVMANEKNMNLEIEAIMLEEVEKKLRALPKEGREDVFWAAVEGLMKWWGGKEEFAVSYLKMCCGEILRQFHATLEGGGLIYFAVVKKLEKKESQTTLGQGLKMSNGAFMQLAEQVLSSETTDEKVRLIQEQVSNLQDFIDVLKADCLFGEEYEALYSALGKWELALLAGYVKENDFYGQTEEWMQRLAPYIEIGAE